MNPNLPSPEMLGIFTPLAFRSATAKNRMVMAPMVTNFANDEDEVTDRQVSYYAERAKGGVGTIIVEGSPVRKDARFSKRQVGSYDDRFIPGLSRLAETIRSRGALALLQLCHGGPKIITDQGLQAVSVSEVGLQQGSLPRSLSSPELRQVRQDFVAAAGRAQKAGFDGVELHAAHFCLLSASLSPFTNTRMDEYGGEIQNRARLTREIILGIKDSLDPDYAVWVRINACEGLNPGLTLEEAQEASNIFAKAGADAIHVSAYTIPKTEKRKGRKAIPLGAAPEKDTPPGPFLEYAASIKKKINISVIAVGKLDDPLLATSALVQGKCDMVALGRQFLCDPYWVAKVKDGRENEIVHCIYCSTCLQELEAGKNIRCTQNLNLYGKPLYKKVPPAQYPPSGS